MISICIPVYNVLISSLIVDLTRQCKSQSLIFEILVYDDGSEDSYKIKNRSITQFKEVVYKELIKNKGCAGIRNQMAFEARYQNLLFIDSDSELNKEYILRYIPFFNQEYSVVCGGRVHPPVLPDLSKSLRWKVGKAKEDFPAKMRNRIPNKSFMSNNFLIQKKVFERVSFNENIPKSGHEDTLFGINLELHGINIKHIDNPVTHMGLESNQEFIVKTRQRLDTLHLLEQMNHENPLFSERIKILKVYNRMNRIGLSFLFSLLYQKCNSLFEKKLIKPNPNLVLYDLYKLGYFASLHNNSKQNSL